VCDALIEVLDGSNEVAHHLTAISTKLARAAIDAARQDIFRNLCHANSFAAIGAIMIEFHQSDSF
jgi:hypothetical protein